MTEHDHSNHEHTDDHADIVLDVQGVTKQFPGVLANDNVNLQLRQGEILALLGENGAGKSTLMNIIYGLYHPNQGTIKLKGQEVRFASSREAIRSGIGMVHQHFQLVNVMTVAENVVLGEEETVAYRGAEGSPLQLLLKWLPSLLVLVLSIIIGASLGKLEYAAGGLIIGILGGLLVAFPPVARVVWGVAWRVGLAFAALMIATQFELITQVGLTDVALRQKVETVREKKPKAMDEGYTVKGALVSRDRIKFKWAKEYRKANEDGTGINGVIESAKTQIAVYRDDGVPGWLIDAIDDVPPVVRMASLVLLLFLFGGYSLSSWRSIETVPRRLHEGDLGVLGILVLAYLVVAWRQLESASTPVQLGLVLLLGVGLGLVAWRTIQQRGPKTRDFIGKTAPLDSIVDALLVTLHSVTQVRNTHAANQQVRELSQQYGLEVDPEAVIEKLPVGAQQRVEIVKALYRQADILILDEPTAVLTPQEGKELFKIMRELSAQGVSIIFITHKLKEVFEVATNIVVMRGGRVVGTTTPDQATETSLAAMMVGREVILQVEKDVAQPAESVLEVSDLSALDNRNAQALNNVSFQVHAGEVLGIAGVQGNGQTELVEVLTGLRESSAGAVKILGTDLQRITPRRIKNIGTSHVPEDRLRHGMVKPYSVADNLVLNDYYERPFAKEPNMAELPLALLRYLVLMGVIIGGLTALVVYLWDHWLWTALLDTFNVPADLRVIGKGLTSNQKAVLRYPFIIGLLGLFVAELVFGVFAHWLTNKVLGRRSVQQAFHRMEQRGQAALWQTLGREGTLPEPKGGLMRDQEAVQQHATRLIEEFDIRTPSPDVDGGNLSGGNQQKMIVAREFSRKPRLLIAAQPTRGIDVGSIEFIHKQIIEQRDAGAAVLLVSAELDEIMGLSDRIAVLYKGEVIDTLSAEEATREQLGLLMAGIH